MSEFECRHGHMMRAGDKFCLSCAQEGRLNEKAYYMDGLSSGQWRKREQLEEAQAAKEDAEDAKANS